MALSFYTCSACECSVAVGCYHGSAPGVWFTALYCRHCATRYTCRQTTDQFLAAFETQPVPQKTWQYDVCGPSTTQHISAGEQLPAPTLTCEVCQATGPFGSEGPITDRPPEGIDAIQSYPFPESPEQAAELQRTMAQKQFGQCPQCRQKSMEFTGDLIT